MIASEFQRRDCLNMDLDAKMQMCIVQKLVQMHLHDVIAGKRFILSPRARLFMHWGLI